MAKEYNTRTASLKATIADIRNLDAKQIKLKDKNILDYIKESEFNSYDTRDPQLKNDELDIWNTEISLSEEGYIEVKPLEHTYDSISSSQSTTLESAVKVIDNEVLGANDVHIMYWQTDGLTNGQKLFLNHKSIAIFESDLLSLKEADGIFKNCRKLAIFNGNLSSLTNGANMFYSCRNLRYFTSNLSSLTNGYYMFFECYFTNFNSSLSLLTSGSNMFYACKNLKSFTSDLSSLTNGDSMFYGCELNAQSVVNIIHTIKNNSDDDVSHIINIGIGCDNTEADKLLFAQECDCETWQELLDDFSAKNWTVEFQCNGRPTTTYNMRRGETLPIYAKLEEVTEGEHYAYTSADGSKFYNIRYFHSTNGSTEGYDVFSSLEEAISTYNVTPKN